MSFDFEAQYDALNPDDHDHRFYARLAVEHGVRRAVDLGCGTGALAWLLADEGIDVTAVDPDAAMLAVARDRVRPAGAAGRVEWREGDSGVLDIGVADLAVMSGHVAQVFTGEESWHATLADLHRTLTPGGLLAFESRNPLARAWEGWTRDRTLRTVRTPEGDVEFWHETIEIALPLVTYDTLTRNLRTGEDQAHRDVLVFRDEEQLRASLAAAGFDVIDVLGDWAGRPVGEQTAELIVLARKR